MDGHLLPVGPKRTRPRKGMRALWVGAGERFSSSRETFSGHLLRRWFGHESKAALLAIESYLSETCFARNYVHTCRTRMSGYHRFNTILLS